MSPRVLFVSAASFGLLCSVLIAIQTEALPYADLDNLKALQRVVQTQAENINELEARVTALADKYSATSDKQPTEPTAGCDCGTLQAKMDELSQVGVDVATLQAKVNGLNGLGEDMSSLRGTVAGLASKAVQMATLEAKVSSLSQRAENVDNMQSQVNDLRIEVATVRAKTTSLGDLRNSLYQLQDQVSNISTTVAFTATFSADDPTHGIYLRPHSILTFDQPVTNIGKAYDPSTGKFTAPVPGTYAFSLNLMAPNAGGHLELGIVKEGVVLDMAWAPDTQDFEDQGSTQVTTHLDAGQQVWVQLEDGNAVRGGYWTVFTGFLLQAE